MARWSRVFDKHLPLSPLDLSLKPRRLSFDPFMATNGVLGGLVAITASSPMVETEGAFVIGVASGALVVYGSKLLLKFRVRPETFNGSTSTFSRPRWSRVLRLDLPGSGRSCHDVQHYTVCPG